MKTLSYAMSLLLVSSVSWAAEATPNESRVAVDSLKQLLQDESQANSDAPALSPNEISNQPSLTLQGSDVIIEPDEQIALPDTESADSP